MSKKTKEVKEKETKETKSKTKKTKVKEIDTVEKLNSDLKKFKIVIGGMAVIMTGTVIGGAMLIISNNNKSETQTETTSDYTTYTKNKTQALESATKVKKEKVEELVKKQEKGDYTLQTMIDVLGSNPACIVENTYDVTYEKNEVKKTIKEFINKKSYEGSETLIEFVWVVDDGTTVTTYLASDITDKVNVVGVFLVDESLDSSSMEKNDKITKTKLTFEELADVDITLEELEDKVGTLYHYSIQYPLLKDSEIVTSNSSKEDIGAILKQSVFKNETSSIVVYSRDNDVLSLSDIPYNNDDIKAFDTATVTKAKDNKELTEEQFNKDFEGAKFVSIEESTTEDDVLYKTYLIKDKDDKAYTVGFENGKISYFEEYGATEEE